MEDVQDDQENMPSIQFNGFTKVEPTSDWYQNGSLATSNEKLGYFCITTSGIGNDHGEKV